jgi:hypothetical protein
VTLRVPLTKYDPLGTTTGTAGPVPSAAATPAASAGEGVGTNRDDGKLAAPVPHIPYYCAVVPPTTTCTR